MRTTSKTRHAVVLLSGGMDSSVTLAIARSKGFDCHALSINYGQRHQAELDAAKRMAKALGAAEHRIVPLDLRWIGGSALTSNIPVPKHHRAGKTIPLTYVPARNTIMLSLALGWAEVLGAHDIFIGVNAVDYSGYPDCRPEFIKAFARTAKLATRAGVEGKKFTIHTPLIRMTKAEIIRAGMKLGVNFHATVTCYDADKKGRACGQCEACRLRRKGFEEAHVPDMTAYKTTKD